MLSVENFKSFEIAIDNASRLQKKIAADLAQYNLLLQEASDLLQRQLALSEAEREILGDMIKTGEERLEKRKQEKEILHPASGSNAT